MTTQMNNPQWTEAANAIQSADSILVVTHISPDGDAIGSLLGLTEALREMGKTVTGAVDDGVPDYLQFVAGADTILSQLTVGEWDLVISTDASDSERSGKVGEYAFSHTQKVINLDHHPTNTLFGDIYLVVPTAVSATEIVFDLWQSMEHSISQVVANALLTGLVTDTLGFRTSNVNARTLEIAQKLIKAGANLTEITACALDAREYAVVELWKRSLPSTHLKDGVIYATVSMDDAAMAGLDETRDGGLVSFLVNVNEASVAVVFKEKPENKVEISFRSKVGYDVGTLAFSLGGGGHKQASGVTVSGSLDEVRARILPLAQKVVEQGTPQSV